MSFAVKLDLVRWQSARMISGLDVQRRPVAANDLRGHLHKRKRQNTVIKRDLARQFGGQPSHFHRRPVTSGDVQKLRENPGKSLERWDFDVQRRPRRFLGSQMIVGASRENRPAMPPKSLNIEGKWAAERLG